MRCPSIPTTMLANVHCIEKLIRCNWTVSSVSRSYACTLHAAHKDTLLARIIIVNSVIFFLLALITSAAVSLIRLFTSCRVRSTQMKMFLYLFSIGAPAIAVEAQRANWKMHIQFRAANRNGFNVNSMYSISLSAAIIFIIRFQWINATVSRWFLRNTNEINNLQHTVSELLYSNCPTRLHNIISEANTWLIQWRIVCVVGS